MGSCWPCCSCCPCCRKDKPPVSTPKYKPNPESEPDFGRKSDPEPESKAGPEPDPGRQPDLNLEAAFGPEPDPGRQLDTEPEAASEPEPDSESTPDLVVPKLKRERRKSLPMPREASPAGKFSRYSDLALDLDNPLYFIHGYQKESILSLEDALKPITDIPKKVDDTSDQIKTADRIKIADQIKKAIKECYYPSVHNLTPDESAAIYIYSMKGENNLHFHYQNAWGSKNKSRMKPWFKYIKLLESAWQKLPDVKTEVWQRIDRKAAEKMLLSGHSRLYTSMGSGSPSIKELNHVLDKKPATETIWVDYGSVSGKDVSLYIEHDVKAHGVGEVLIWPGAKVGVAHVEDNEDGSKIVRLKILAGHFVCPMSSCTNCCNVGRRGH